MVKVLVTGGAGYIGSVLCEHLLDAGYDVTVLDNFMYGQTSLFNLCNNPRFHFVYGDSGDIDLLNKLASDVDVIIPLAAIVGAPACNRNSDLAWRINYDNIHLFGDLVNAKDKLIIFPNTNSGYGSQSEICTEDTPLQPVSLYGLTKTYAEDWLLETLSNSIVLRLATVFGMSPRMRTDLLVNDFVYKAVTDGYLVLFESHFKRNFVHIRDVADCFIHCIENADSMVGRAYNVGNNYLNMTKENLAIAVRDRTNCELYYSTTGEDPDKRDYIVSNKRLLDAGFEAWHSLDEGIEELIKGYQMMPVGVYRNA